MFRRPAFLFAAAFALLLSSGCHRPAAPAKAKPEPFTGQLPEVEGVQAIICLRHPKLVNEDLEKLMTAVPETAMLRGALAQLTPFGYPEFSDFAPGSGVGVAILKVSPAELKAGSAVFIGFVRTDAGGKLWNLLRRRRLAVEQRGGWVLFAKSPAILAQLPSPQGVIAFLERPQSEDLRFWGRASPEFLAGLKAVLLPGFKEKIAGLPAVKRKAALGYFDALASLAGEMHSVDFGLTLTDTGVTFREGAQFLPGTAIGTALSYPAGPTPAVAARVSADALGTIVVRQDPQAAAGLARSVCDALIAVDDPPVSARLAKFKASYLALVAAGDGGGAGVLDLTWAPRKSGPSFKPEFFYVMSGNFSPALARSYFQDSQGLTGQFAAFALPKYGSAAGPGLVRSSSRYAQDAVVVDGVSFDSSTLSTALNGREISSLTEYVGIADGQLVLADSEAALRGRLPALLARSALADGIPVPAGRDEIGRITLNGGRLVDLVAAQFKLDLSDPDVRAQLAGLKSGYASGAPVTAVVTAGQAKAAVALNIPYPFIAASIHLGQAAGSWRSNLAARAAGSF